jgi:nicotinamidase-related amidase
MSTHLSRDVPIDPAHAAVLFIDVQNYTARLDGGEYAGLDAAERDARYGWFFRTMRETAVPNMHRLQAACRRGRIEIIYTVIEALTRDGRDLSLDYRISGLFVPRDPGTRRSWPTSNRAKTRLCCRRPRRQCSYRRTLTTCCAIWACAR